jgi:hypothetical protein
MEINEKRLCIKAIKQKSGNAYCPKYTVDAAAHNVVYITMSK